jgi:hypothetical protein
MFLMGCPRLRDDPFYHMADGSATHY